MLVTNPLSYVDVALFSGVRDLLRAFAIILL